MTKTQLGRKLNEMCVPEDMYRIEGVQGNGESYRLLQDRKGRWRVYIKSGGVESMRDFITEGQACGFMLKRLSAYAKAVQ